MYVPKHFEEKDGERLGRLIVEYAFGHLVTSDKGRPFCSHLPFLYQPGKLLCHLARANPQVAHLESSEEVLAIYSGPHAYISPSWYESPGVPTWNYAAAHVYGRPRAVRSTSDLRRIVEQMTTYFEAREPAPWEPIFDESMLNGIVGFEIEITEIEGKFKLSQNRPERDRENVIARLDAQGSDLSVGTADFMRELQQEWSGE